jgi:hypothetical protein
MTMQLTLNISNDETQFIEKKFNAILKTNLKKTLICYPMVHYSVPHTGYERMNFHQLIQISNLLDQFFLTLTCNEEVRKNPMNRFCIQEVLDPVYEKIYKRFQELIPQVQELPPNLFAIPFDFDVLDLNLVDISIPIMQRIDEMLNVSFYFALTEMLINPTQSIQLMQMVLNAGYNPDWLIINSHSFFRPLNIAVEAFLKGLISFEQFKKIFEMMIEKGADINGEDEKGNSPLIIAIISKNIGLINFLIEHQVDINSSKTLGPTPLMVACISSTIEIVEHLIKNGAQINALDCLGWNAYSYATIFDNQNPDQKAIKHCLENNKVNRLEEADDSKIHYLQAHLIALLYINIQNHQYINGEIEVISFQMATNQKKETNCCLC